MKVRVMVREIVLKAVEVEATSVEDALERHRSDGRIVDEQVTAHEVVEWTVSDRTTVPADVRANDEEPMW